MKSTYQIQIVLQSTGHQMIKQETAHTPQVFRLQILTVMPTILSRYPIVEKQLQLIIRENPQSHQVPLPQFRRKIVT